MQATLEDKMCCGFVDNGYNICYEKVISRFSGYGEKLDEVTERICKEKDISWEKKKKKS